jgi:Tol biopolymer transport system component
LENGQELSDVAGNPVSHSIPGNATQGRFSATGDRIVFRIMDDNLNSDIAIYDVANETLSRRTFSGRTDRPLWTPDGRQLVYRQIDDDGFSVWVMNADGSGQPEQLMTASMSLSPTSFSPDGQQLILSQGVGGVSLLKVLSLQEIENPIQDLLPSDEIQDTAEISPDGRWIVYRSNEINGENRIFARPFPNVDDGKWLVSDITASEAHWGADGSIYFVSGSASDGTIYRVAVDTSVGFNTEPAEAITRSSHIGNMEPNFNVSPDGSHLLYRSPSISTSNQTDILVLVENWFNRLSELAQPN